jgi:hypothetical protein
VRLILEVVARASITHTEWVAALNHEAWDDAVKNDAVVKRSVLLLASLWVGPLFSAFSEALKVGYRYRCVVAKEVDLDGAVVGVQSCYRCVRGHEPILA